MLATPSARRPLAHRRGVLVLTLGRDGSPRAMDAGCGGRRRVQALVVDRPTAFYAQAVSAIVDSMKSVADGLKLGSTEIVQALQHFVVLELGGPLVPVAIVSAPKIRFDAPDALSDLGQTLLQLPAQSTLI